MNFLCECGHQIYDTTDYLPYKAYLISDQDWFDFLDEIDAAIEKSGTTLEDKEKALIKIRTLSSNLTKTVYQCPKCGNLFFYNNPPQLKVFKSCNDNVDKRLLQSAKGDKWQGFLYGDWVDNNPTWRVKGYISGSSIEGKEYDNWELLEKEYYLIYNDLKNKNILRRSSLKKNNIEVHSWSLT